MISISDTKINNSYKVLTFKGRQECISTYHCPLCGYPLFHYGDDCDPKSPAQTFSLVEIDRVCGLCEFDGTVTFGDGIWVSNLGKYQTNDKNVLIDGKVGEQDLRIAKFKAARVLVFGNHEITKELVRMPVDQRIRATSETNSHAAVEPCLSLAFEVLIANFNEDEQKHVSLAIEQQEDANAFYRQGSFSTAVEQANSAAENWLRLLGEKHPDYAQCLILAARSYRAMNDFKRSQEHYKCALDSFLSKKWGSQEVAYADCLVESGDVSILLGETGRAKTLFTQALRIYGARPGEKFRGYASMLSKLANLYQELEDDVRAETFFEEAIKVQGFEPHPEYLNSLKSLATIYESRGELERAEPLRDILVRLSKTKF